jgi:hypothetical protein
MARRTPGIDAGSPVPLYHQIAEAIRARIESGELAPGEVLEPLRQAAETWKVNLHTVRHAYTALARSGLIESRRGPGGTRVLGCAPDRPYMDDLQTYARRIAEEASRLYGAGPAELARALTGLQPAPGGASLPVVWVAECSAWQTECHARELRERFRVDARPWLIGDDEPPAGTVVSTYFHYNDVRLLWPRRMGSVRFCSIHPDPALVHRITEARRVVVTERDESTVAAVVADLVALLGDVQLALEPRVTGDPAGCLEPRDDAPVLFPPRIWSDLDETARRDPRSVEVRYVFEPRELERLGAAMGWERHRPRAVA